MTAKLLTPAVTFTPGAAGAGTLDLSGIAGFDIRRLIAVINLTRNAVLYIPSSTPYAGIAGAVLTLSVDTSTHNAADQLWVKYDDGTQAPLVATTAAGAKVGVAADDLGRLIATVQDLGAAVHGLLDAIANPVSIETSSGRQRVVLDATGGAQTLGTVSTVTSLSQIGGVAANSSVLDLMTLAWSESVRVAVS